MNFLDIFKTCPPCEFGGEEKYGTDIGFNVDPSHMVRIFTNVNQYGGVQDPFSGELLLPNELNKWYETAVPIDRFEGESGKLIVTYKKKAGWYSFLLPFTDATHNAGKKTAKISISSKGWFSIGQMLNAALGCNDYRCGIDMEVFVDKRVRVKLGGFTQDFPLLSLYVIG